MPGLPHERDRAFFSARNLLERKHLGEFLSELGQLEVGGLGGVPGAAVQAPRRPLPPANSPPFAPCAALLQGPLAGPAKPPELINFNTAQTVGEAMKVCRRRAVPPTPGPPRVLLAPLPLCHRPPDWPRPAKPFPCPHHVPASMLPEQDALSSPASSSASRASLPAQMLAAYNILSAPVSDAGTGEYVGMLDVADIMGGLVRGRWLAVLVGAGGLGGWRGHRRFLQVGYSRGPMGQLHRQPACLCTNRSCPLPVAACPACTAGVYPELLQGGFLEHHKRLSISELQSGGVCSCSCDAFGWLGGGATSSRWSTSGTDEPTVNSPPCTCCLAQWGWSSAGAQWPTCCMEATFGSKGCGPAPQLPACLCLPPAACRLPPAACLPLPAFACAFACRCLPPAAGRRPPAACRLPPPLLPCPLPGFLPGSPLANRCSPTATGRAPCIFPQATPSPTCSRWWRRGSGSGG